MQRRRFLGFLAASMAPSPSAGSVFNGISAPAIGALTPATSISPFKTLLNDLAFKALLEPDNVLGEVQYAFDNGYPVDVERIIAQAFTSNQEIINSAMQLAKSHPSFSDMVEILSGLKRDDAAHYESLFAEIAPEELAARFEQQFTNGKEGIRALVDEFDARLKAATRAEIEIIKRANELETNQRAKNNGNNMATPYPAFGTANHPIAAGEFDEAHDFYGEYAVDTPNKGFPAESTALASKAADYSKQKPYTHVDERTWHKQLNNVVPNPPMMKPTR